MYKQRPTRLEPVILVLTQFFMILKRLEYETESESAEILELGRLKSTIT